MSLDQTIIMFVSFSDRPRGDLETTILQEGPSPQQRSQSSTGSQISCDRSHLRYDLCSVNATTIMDPTISTFFVTGPTNSPPNFLEKIKPYPRKFEAFIMAQIKELTIKSGPPSPLCQIRHRFPALVFSDGGYTGNFFHDFNDGFIPLFITLNTIFSDQQDFILVASEAPDWWIDKYKDLIQAFTKHPIVTLNDTVTHCFPSATFGLISHGFMIINQTLIPNSKTFIDFRSLLDKSYTQNNQTLNLNNSKPRLLLASRNGSIGRVIINQNQVIKEMEEIGFDVTIFEPISNSSLSELYGLINSSHAMVGVHGAALTHSLFLRPGAVFVQVVPIGVEWASDVYFGRVGRGLKLEYMEYRIGVEESSLAEKYGKESILLRDPHGVQVKGEGWPTQIMDSYLKEQNVKLDIQRFGDYLKKAYDKAKKFMERQG
ncbi:xylan glycosyltransferase MUCI21-like [Euphorbia lathyris]|uniref:xylan glycosyltransferase MUCI21-like n=1 Tax=Euphorbia lathyris TaxID=212925 RepID=UPI0033133238